MVVCILNYMENRQQSRFLLIRRIMADEFVDASHQLLTYIYFLFYCCSFHSLLYSVYCSIVYCFIFHIILKLALYIFSIYIIRFYASNSPAITFILERVIIASDKLRPFTISLNA